MDYLAVFDRKKWVLKMIALICKDSIRKLLTLGYGFSEPNSLSNSTLRLVLKQMKMSNFGILYKSNSDTNKAGMR